MPTRRKQSIVHIVYTGHGGIPDIVAVFANEKDAEECYHDCIVENGEEVEDGEYEFDSDIEEINGRKYLIHGEDFDYHLSGPIAVQRNGKCNSHVSKKQKPNI